MNKDMFKKICDAVAEVKKGSYCIYALVFSDYAELKNDIYETKDELRKQVAEFARKKIKCLYTVKDEN